MPIQWKLNSPQFLKSGWVLALFFTLFLPKKDTDTEYWHFKFLFHNTDTDTNSIFFRLNTATDTSVFGNHTGYWILVFSFCTGQVSASFPWKLAQIYTVEWMGRHFDVFPALLMFCLLNPQMNACEPNPKTTSSDFNR